MGKGARERLRRVARTVFFMVAMVASLAVLSAPVIVAVGDVMVQCMLISSFTCMRCYGLKEHLRRYAFKSSLIDFPLVSTIRSIIIACVYSLCDGDALYHGPYLGSITLCSFVSILALSVKACVFSVNSEIEAEAQSFLSRKKLHLKKSWGMPVLFLSSVVFALGHTVVAYRTSCRARRKLLLRADPEAVLSCKNVFSSCQKVPRSPTPSGGRTSKSEGEMRQNPLGEGDLPVRLLADVDSLFTFCQGLTLHFKLSMSRSPSRSLSFAGFLEPYSCVSSSQNSLGKLKLDRPVVCNSSKGQNKFHRSFSNQFHNSSLYAPLLDSPVSSPVLSEELPVLCLDNDGHEEQVYRLSSGSPKQDPDGIGQTVIVFVHGFGGGVFSWRHLMGELAHQAGCAVAAFDRPGWGFTSRPRREDWEGKQLPNPYKLDTQVDLLLSFCVEMRFSSVILVGHDDGGLLALKAAHRANSHVGSVNIAVKGVILLSVGLSREVVPAFARILLYTSVGKKHLVRPLLRTEITHVVNRRAWYDATKLTAEVLNLYKAPLYVEGWDEALHEIGKVSCESVLSPQNAASLLKAVEDLPVLVVVGAEDALVSLKSTQALASQLVNSRLVTISGCGHLPHEECPKALLAAMLPFLSRLTQRPDSGSN